MHVTSVVKDIQAHIEQLKIVQYNDIIIEWIPYNQFIDIKNIEKNVDNAITIYSALWNNGSLHYGINQEETRKPNTNVVLKCLNNSQNIINIIDEFLIEANTCYDDIHGISQNPDTKITSSFYKIYIVGNEIIDDIIQEVQLKINVPSDIVIEWIPFNQFINIKEIEKVDDNTTTYSAFWNNGPCIIILI
ncbi:unnamed protein product [Rhizophagus irregularis]|nr:unnamed protein product [Rhizophagus irregularis]